MPFVQLFSWTIFLLKKVCDEWIEKCEPQGGWSMIIMRCWWNRQKWRILQGQRCKKYYFRLSLICCLWYSLHLSKVESRNHRLPFHTNRDSRGLEQIFGNKNSTKTFKSPFLSGKLSKFPGRIFLRKFPSLPINQMHILVLVHICLWLSGMSALTTVSYESCCQTAQLCPPFVDRRSSFPLLHCAKRWKEIFDLFWGSKVPFGPGFGGRWKRGQKKIGGYLGPPKGQFFL